MAQVLEFKLPDLGEGLTEAEIVRWLVDVGDVVAVDQPVVEVETAKAMVEVPCPYGGVVTARYGEEGTELPVGAPLITVAVGSDEPGSESAEPTDAAGEESGNVLVGYGTRASSGRRRRVRTGIGVGIGAGPGSVPAADGSPETRPGSKSHTDVSRTDGSRRDVSRTDAPRPPAFPVASRTSAPPAPDRADAPPVHPDGPVAVISPLVRRIARDNGVDLRTLHGSGPDGLILRADVEDVLRARTAAPDRPAAARDTTIAPVTPSAPPGGLRIPLKGVRGAVADKLARSRREIPDATCWVDADATELMRARAAMNAAGAPKISLLALLARICTAALARHPELNSYVDTEAREIVQLDQVHLGFAAQTPRGLVVPVVRDAHARDAEGLTGEFARLTELAREGTLTPADLTGGTFTLNNYGVFGVDGSTPIVNHPEAAMLGVGRIVPKPWVHEGELAVRQVVQLSLTFDHRVCDGGTAGGFLRYVADCVEQPAVLLRTL
ncbi:2-oxo acid dehydrogenase subunit E2 [Streptomyces sp. DSM 110735]|uniref:2-oxo acid dehydrogenase subunit E2 n=1 Tax=Streptomyces sp. DSM 110735 TaxID=2775031 RepID=UPI0018F51075|nr:2-oxo acid dehydrogenase subunit E2 [Streptomyces sp. DSM 110735]MBJ7901964.1 2-oxo acid dehydrogenase subunit E2 [Streptomyces sp. DSM 110735]